jgi:hypothetical protein
MRGNNVSPMRVGRSLLGLIVCGLAVTGLVLGWMAYSRVNTARRQSEKSKFCFSAHRGEFVDGDDNVGDELGLVAGWMELDRVERSLKWNMTFVFSPGCLLTGWTLNGPLYASLDAPVVTEFPMRGCSDHLAPHGAEDDDDDDFSSSSSSLSSETSSTSDETTETETETSSSTTNSSSSESSSSSSSSSRTLLEYKPVAKKQQQKKRQVAVPTPESRPQSLKAYLQMLREKGRQGKNNYAAVPTTEPPVPVVDPEISERKRGAGGRDLLSVRDDTTSSSSSSEASEEVVLIVHDSSTTSSSSSTDETEDSSSSWSSTTDEESEESTTDETSLTTDETSLTTDETSSSDVETSSTTDETSSDTSSSSSSESFGDDDDDDFSVSTHDHVCAETNVGFLAGILELDDATIDSILYNPPAYYLNFLTTCQPDGAAREALHAICPMVNLAHHTRIVFTSSGERLRSPLSVLF